MILDILTPDKKLFEGEAEAVTVPGISGSMQFLKGHAPLISALGKGEITVKTSKGDQAFKINGGVVEVLNNKVIVLAE
jgi:F-type H+-transporting ATPase subunit epsilon